MTDQIKAAICDSETSVDYYVTTVNARNRSSIDTDDDDTEKPISRVTSVVVSVDQAGTVKLRRRKKSKKRKKKSLIYEDPGLHASDDGVLYQSSGSDGSYKNVPRRASSLCDRYLRNHSTTESFNKILSEHKRSRRKRHTSSFSKKPLEGKVSEESGIQNCGNENSNVIENGKVNLSPTPSKGQSSEQKSISGVQDSITPLLIYNSAPKKLNKIDAIATLTAYMQEVKEATTVAREQEEVKKGSDIRKSKSMDELGRGEDERYSLTEMTSLPDAKLSIAEKAPENSILPPSNAQCAVLVESNANDKSDFVTSGNLIKSSSEESRIEKQALLNLMAMERVNRAVSDHLTTRPLTYCNASKDKNFDYGLAHLEQVCKLIEQIGELRKQNVALVKKVRLLEAEVKHLKSEKDYTAIDASLVETYHTLTLPKRSQRVGGRLKEAIIKSRKSSVDKQDGKRTNQLLRRRTDSGDRISLGASMPSSSFKYLKNRPLYHSSINLTVHRDSMYSHDDLELANKKDKWRFWKTPSRSVDRPPPIKRPPSYSPTSKSSKPIQRAYRTVDSLLSSAGEDSRVRPGRLSSSRPIRTSSAVSDIVLNGDKLGADSRIASKPPIFEEGQKFKNRQIENKKAVTVHKESFRQKLGKLERAAMRKFTFENFKRSNSMDRVNRDEVLGEDYFPTSQDWVNNDIYKSMPCVMTASTDNRYEKAKKYSVHSATSSEWNGLQEAFPTRPKNGFNKVLNGLKSSSSIRSRLPSPLRRKASNKRKTWSLVKRKSNYFLPTGDYGFGSTLELAESTSEKYALDIDQEALKEVTHAGEPAEKVFQNFNFRAEDDEMNHVNGVSEPVHGELTHMDENLNGSSLKLIGLPGSVPVPRRYERKPVAHSSLPSRRKRVPRPKSCDLLSSYW